MFELPTPIKVSSAASMTTFFFIFYQKKFIIKKKKNVLLLVVESDMFLYIFQRILGYIIQENGMVEILIGKERTTRVIVRMHLKRLL